MGHLLSNRWHLGYCNDSYLPTSRGFESFYGFFMGGEDYYTHSWPGAGVYDFFDDQEVDLSANGTYSTVSSFIMLIVLV